MAMLHKGGQRGAAIVKQLLAFSRSMAEARVILDPRGVIRETAAAVRARFPSNISVLEQNGEDLGRILAEPAQLRQVLMNLCANARDAMPGGGVLTLGLERVQVPTQPLSESGALRGGAYLVISVSDTGRGISPEDIERIFDPFFTTKEIGNGIGLGLATVHGIVKAHRGLVRVESTPGQGARFRVFLPAANAPTQ
jgi:signal transduction histidine kinase